MLVLTRKMNEQIVIGDNIKITLVRVRGNSVRIGIEAPREVRVVRGELNVHDIPCEHQGGLGSNSASHNCGEKSCEELQLSEREHAFAHPVVDPCHIDSNAKNGAGKKASGTVPKLDVFPAVSRPSIDTTVPRQVFVGRVNRSGDAAELRRAPLARFMSAQ